MVLCAKIVHTDAYILPCSFVKLSCEQTVHDRKTRIEIIKNAFVICLDN